MTNRNFTRKDLSNKIFRNLGFSKNLSSRIVDDFFETLMSEIIKLSKFDTRRICTPKEQSDYEERITKLEDEKHDHDDDSDYNHDHDNVIGRRESTLHDGLSIVISNAFVGTSGAGTFGPLPPRAGSPPKGGRGLKVPVPLVQTKAFEIMTIP